MQAGRLLQKASRTSSCDMCRQESQAHLWLQRGHQVDVAAHQGQQALLQCLCRSGRGSCHGEAAGLQGMQGRGVSADMQFQQACNQDGRRLPWADRTTCAVQHTIPAASLTCPPLPTCCASALSRRRPPRRPFCCQSADTVLTAAATKGASAAASKLCCHLLHAQMRLANQAAPESRALMPATHLQCQHKHERRS